MKGLILSGGKGSRLRPFTYTGAKQLVPVANKPILFYAVEALAAAGITEIGIITGDTGQQVRDALGDGSRFGAKLTFIPQDAPLGIAHAVKIAAPFLGDSPFAVFLGDNFLRGGIGPFVRAFSSSGADAQVLLTPVVNPQEFGVALLDAHGRPVRLIEKPAEPPTDLAIVGIYMFGPRFFEAVEQVTPSARGELEITDTIQKLIDIGAHVRAEVVRDSWIDTGKMVDLLTANRICLDDVEPCTEGAEVDASSRISGRVVLQPGARIINSIIHGPVIIGENTEVIDSYVGPYTSIYHDCRLISTEIEASVVLERCSIDHPGARIHESLIGRDVSVSGASEKPRALRLTLGDHSRVQVP
ncbi:MAG TPA: glucose-1-phosphate thymidylyltransferase [Dehalococcoidia bacterium]|nr:glucose-1-phosphate thymidylyltransferase [Dehalococcoidia bacterium]